MRGQMIKIGKRSENRLIGGTVIRRNQMRILRAIAAVFNRAFHWAKRLRPKAVLAPVPEQEGTIGHSRNRHGPAPGRPHAFAKRQVVLELAL